MRSYSHLSEDERDQIDVLRAAGWGAIARAGGLGSMPPGPAEQNSSQRVVYSARVTVAKAATNERKTDMSVKGENRGRGRFH